MTTFHARSTVDEIKLNPLLATFFVFGQFRLSFPVMHKVGIVGIFLHNLSAAKNAKVANFVYCRENSIQCAGHIFTNRQTWL